MKSNISNGEQKQLIKQILVKDFISSEKSDVDEVDGKERHVIVIKPLPWRGKKAGRVEKA